MREETIEIHGTRVNYKTAGDPPPPEASDGRRGAILILHGWGSSSDSWIEVQKNLVQYGYNVVVPDLPGFGKTTPPAEVWGVEDYANFVFSFTKA